MRSSGVRFFAAAVLAAVPMVFVGPAAAGASPADRPPCLRTISVDSPSVTEGTPQFPFDFTPLMIFTVTTTGCTANPAQVDFHATDIGFNYDDFAHVSGTLSWPAGSGASRSIIVRVRPDSIPELDESVTVKLCNESAAVHLAANSAFGTIIDDDRGAPVRELPPIGFVCK